MRATRLLVLALALLPLGALAEPISYGFQVVATDGPLCGTTAFGVMTIEDYIIPPGGGTIHNPPVFEALRFTWNGIAWDRTNTRISALTFDESGSLTAATSGVKCLLAGCQVTAGTNGRNAPNETAPGEISEGRYFLVAGAGFAGELRSPCACDRAKLGSPRTDDLRP